MGAYLLQHGAARRVLTIYDPREGYLDGLIDEHRRSV